MPIRSLSWRARKRRAILTERIAERFERYAGLSIGDLYRRHADLDRATFDMLHDRLGSDAIAKIGGYGRFVQRDPREGAPEGEDWLVLLNIRSASLEEGADILWGDAGTGSFPIRREDLARRDFSNVAYYWDNH